MKLYPTGTCFDDVAQYVGHLVGKDPRRMLTDEYMICHGIITKDSGELASHAWLEKEPDQLITSGIFSGRLAYATVSRSEYYAEMGVTDVTRYTIAEALVMEKKFQHGAPWEDRYRRLCRDFSEAAP